MKSYFLIFWNVIYKWTKINCNIVLVTQDFKKRLFVFDNVRNKEIFEKKSIYKKQDSFAAHNFVNVFTSFIILLISFFQKNKYRFFESYQFLNKHFQLRDGIYSWIIKIIALALLLLLLNYQDFVPLNMHVGNEKDHLRNDGIQWPKKTDK